MKNPFNFKKTQTFDSIVKPLSEIVTKLEAHAASKADSNVKNLAEAERFKTLAEADKAEENASMNVADKIKAIIS